jgi:predicted transcriptional regulator
VSDETWGPPPPQGTRKKVNDYVASHPGTHARRIGKELGLTRGDLQYHLYALEKEGLIRTRRRGLYKFVFPSKIFGEKQEIVLSLLSQETPSEILLFLIKTPDATQTDLVEHLKFSAPTVSWPEGPGQSATLERVGSILGPQVLKSNRPSLGP